MPKIHSNPRWKPVQFPVGTCQWPFLRFSGTSWRFRQRTCIPSPMRSFEQHPTLGWHRFLDMVVPKPWWDLKSWISIPMVEKLGWLGGPWGTPWLRKLFMVAQSFLTLSPLLWLSLYPYIPFYPFRLIDMAQLKGWTMSNPNSTPILNSQTGWIYIKWFESPSGKLTYLWNIANVLLSIYYLRWWFSTFPSATDPKKIGKSCLTGPSIPNFKNLPERNHIFWKSGNMGISYLSILYCFFCYRVTVYYLYVTLQIISRLSETYPHNSPMIPPCLLVKSQLFDADKNIQ